MKRSPRFQAHYKTGTVARFETMTDKGPLVHEVSTTTRHGGYDVATTLAGFIDPRSLSTYSDRDEAIAEARRRAEGAADGPALTAEARLILAMVEDQAGAAVTIDSLRDAWEVLFRAGRTEPAERLAGIIRVLEGEGGHE